VNNRVRLEVLDLIDRVIAVCGGGRYAIAGARATIIERELRRLAVDAWVFEMESPPAVGSADVIWLDGALDRLDEGTRVRAVQAMREIEPRALLLQAGAGHDDWTRMFLRHDWRRHPQCQSIVNYASLEHLGPGSPMLFEPMPASAMLARAPEDLAATRDLHMDMLREAGRRADAHVARYQWARQFVRPGDRVLDAACGLGYGSALLADATLAESVRGLDADPWAVAYAREHYGAARSRLTFDTCDLETLDEHAPASYDLVVSFETIEHLANPERFVEACRRLLTPGGRLLCSVPNEWVDETGKDPNPFHLHVFDRARLESLCSTAFAVEHVYGQTAGGGMKLGDRPRDLWNADDRADDAEWWLLVGMSDPLAVCEDRVRTRWAAPADGGSANLLAFDRDYEHPWLVRAMVSIGQRTTSTALLTSLAASVRQSASAGSGDQGAALCVQAYRALESDRPDPALLEAIDEYAGGPAQNAHARRWQISLRYVEGLLHLAAGDRAAAARALEQCATADPLEFSPLLATKTVSAASLLGWMSAQDGRLECARRWWRHGVDAAEQALRSPWSELLVDRDEPVIFGLREATQIVDLASQCATALHLLPHAAERPGILASQLAETQMTRLSAAQRALELQSLPVAADGITAPDKGAPVPVDHVRRVVVFGTGSAGKVALDLAAACRWDVSYLVDNNPEMWGREAHGLPVRSPEALERRGYDMVVVASMGGKAAIFDQLQGLGLSYREDFIYFLDAVEARGLSIRAK
jgi:2-polyprenyl-3-methyl-5-hydroxy-6-metoxy-1,4-benzoquinol methylase